MIDTNGYFGYPWVIFMLAKESYAVPCQYVQMMGVVPSVTTIPNAPAFIRGTIQNRNQTTPLIDLRVRLNMLSFPNELETQMKRREQDHINWINELENSVKENRLFELTTDHHKCKFGKWFDTYEPKSYEEGEFLKKFDTPHQKIHKIAIKVEEYVKKKEQRRALEIIKQVRDNELVEMINLFPEFIEITRQQTEKEVVVILDDNNSRTSITADSIIGVEKLKENTFEPISTIERTEDSTLIYGIAKLTKSDSVVLLLDVKNLLKEAHS